MMNNNQEETAIEIKDLDFNYGQQKIINNFSLKIKKGEFVALLGPNGVGKTTIFNIISGILPFKKGSVKIFDRSISKMRPGEIAKYIGVVPQESTSNFNFSNLEIVLMGKTSQTSRFKNETEDNYKLAMESMKLTKTEHLSDRGFMEISGGEKQRVVIAQVITQETDILLLDEPTSNLDINFQIEIMQLISKIKKDRNLTVVGVFHDMNLAAQYVSRIVLMKDGKIFKDSTPEKVLTPENIYDVFRAHIITERNPFTNKIYITPHYNNHNEFIVKPEKRRKIHIIAGGGSGSYLFNILSGEGHDISTCILSSIDTDAKIAQQLKIPLIIEDPHLEISEENIKLNKKFIENSDVIVISRVQFGRKNYSNLLSVEEALSLNKEVYFIDGSNFSSRDYTNGHATELFKKILKKGAVSVDNEEELAILLREGGDR
ncbi:MAG: ABC transporter ATP-binding protein [Actinomycetia bacterium]|nr:ABC transporter ATP-binding protein [Actinomycetes bacterium]